MKKSQYNDGNYHFLFVLLDNVISNLHLGSIARPVYSFTTGINNESDCLPQSNFVALCMWAVTLQIIICSDASPTYARHCITQRHAE